MPKGKINIDINSIISEVRAAYGKDKSLAEQVVAGSNLSRPSKDTDFVLWKDSPWHELTGVPGLVWGRVQQVSGKADSGKSTHAMQFMKLAQDQGCLVILLDTESKFSPTRYDKYFKGDSSQLIVVNSRLILEAGDQVEKVVHAAKGQNSDLRILIVWDSIGSALAKNEDEGSLLEGKQMASAAKENGQVVRAFIRLMEKYKNRERNEETISVLLINQTYSSIGPMSKGQINSGGAKLEYFSSLIVQLSRIKDLTKVVKGVKRKIGIVTRAKVKKNHLFDGEDSVAELDLVITAGGIDLLSNQKVKKDKSNESGWEDNSDDGEVELESE